METGSAAFATDRLGLASKRGVDVAIGMMGGRSGRFRLKQSGRGGGCGRHRRSRRHKHGDGVGEDAPKGRARGLGSMGRGRASVNLIKAVVTDARGDYWGCGGLEDGERDVAGWVEEGKVGSVEERGGARGARVAEHATAFATVLDGEDEKARGQQTRGDVRVCAQREKRERDSRSCRR